MKRLGAPLLVMASTAVALESWALLGRSLNEALVLPLLGTVGTAVTFVLCRLLDP